MNSNIELHSIVKQMEKQISDQLCTSLDQEIDRLLEHHQDMPHASNLLRMIQSIGQYLNSRRDKSHPDALPVLKSISDAFETILSQPGPDPNEPQPLVNEVMAQYRMLQNKLASKPDVKSCDIENLKQVILSIDWEISDQTLKDFESELNRQIVRFKPYNIHHTLLRMIHSTGNYVAVNKANAHTDSINFLRSIFNAFEKIIDNPDMTLEQKKDILQKAIRQFEAFKLKITAKPKPQKKTAPIVEDPSMAPALSHVKSSTTRLTRKADDFVPLTALDEDAVPLSTTDEDVTPALSDKKSSPNGSTDVMDDLFSVKESPADELLDAIHLLDVHGGGQDQVLDMLDQSSNNDGEGVKNFTPQKKETEPIPEIGSRLDEFFNLEPPSESTKPPIEKQADSRQIEPAEAIEIKDENEGIVPFDYEDENEPGDTGEDEPNHVDTTELLLLIKSKLVSALEENNPLEKDLLDEKIRLLKECFEQDEEKTMLIDTLNTTLTLVQQQQTPSDLPAAGKKEQKGFWAKFKGVFSS